MPFLGNSCYFKTSDCICAIQEQSQQWICQGNCIKNFSWNCLVRIRNYELAYFISVLHTSLRGFPRSAYITQRISSFCIRHLEDFHVLHTSLRGFPRSAYVTQRISSFCIRHSQDFLVLHTSLRGFPRSAYVTQRISSFCIRHSEDFLVFRTTLSYAAANAITQE